MYWSSLSKIKKHGLLSKKDRTHTHTSALSQFKQTYTGALSETTLSILEVYNIYQEYTLSLPQLL